MWIMLNEAALWLGVKMRNKLIDYCKFTNFKLNIQEKIRYRCLRQKIWGKLSKPKLKTKKIGKINYWIVLVSSHAPFRTRYLALKVEKMMKHEIITRCDCEEVRIKLYLVMSVWLNKMSLLNICKIQKYSKKGFVARNKYLLFTTWKFRTEPTWPYYIW